MSSQKNTPCPRERIVDALAPHLTGKDTADMAGWLCGLRAGQATHLDALSLGECQHVMEQLYNALDKGLLIRRYRTARRFEALMPPEQEQAQAQGETWLR